MCLLCVVVLCQPASLLSSLLNRQLQNTQDTVVPCRVHAALLRLLNEYDTA